MVAMTAKLPKQQHIEESSMKCKNDLKMFQNEHKGHLDED